MSSTRPPTRFHTLLLPAIIGRYFKKRARRQAMLHAVPSSLAKNKDLVACYQRHWNRLVSPGEAVYAHHGAGEELLLQAQQAGAVPGSEIHDKTIFL